jgi:putative FmdB family regulatory protein
MPIYEYECGECLSKFEIKQSFHDEAKAVCRRCGGQARRVFKPVPIVFKGSGFYVTDNGGKKNHLVDTFSKDKSDSVPAVSGSGTTAAGSDTSGGEITKSTVK